MSEPHSIRRLYRKLLTLYPRGFQERLGESMEQTFNDMCNERKEQAQYRWSGFVLWIFVETAIGVVREHVLQITKGAAMKNTLAVPRSTALISSILLAVAFIVAPAIYLFGNLRDAMGPFAYAMADFLYGPVWAASLVALVFMLRERIGASAPRRMSLALLAAVLAAGTMILVACIRSANRQYHLIHPELHLEEFADGPYRVDDPCGRRDRGRLALFRVGAGPDRIHRLDIAPPSPSIERTVFGGRGSITVRISVVRTRGAHCDVGHGSEYLARDPAMERRARRNASAGDNHKLARSSLSLTRSTFRAHMAF